MPEDKTDENKEISPALNGRIRPTGIQALDSILNGGLPNNASVLLSGDAGAGKTTLAMQWLTAGYGQLGESGIYITMTEPTTTLLRNLGETSYYKNDYLASSDLNASNFESEIARRNGIHLIDLRPIMDEIGLRKSVFSDEDVDLLIDTLIKLISNANIKRVVLDSITAVAYLLRDEAMIRSFIFKFGKYLSTLESNMLLISEAKNDDDSVFGLEEFISDGVIHLSYGAPEKKLPRTLKVKKLRGVDFNPRPIPYKITKAGLHLFTPRQVDLNFPVSDQRLSSGVPGFDKITKGGYIETSSILISGPSGSGKTLFALQSLISVLKAGQKAVYFSFEEPRSQLVRNAKSFGWDIESFEEQGLLKIVIAHPEELFPQEHISVIEDTIHDFEPKLVVVDSLSAIENTFSSEIIHDWSTQVISLFKTARITSLFTDVTNEIVGSSRASDNSLSSLFDQIVIFRYVEIAAEFQHAALVLKMRGSHHDKKMYNLEFTSSGLRILDSYSGYEGVFTGSARQVSESTEKQIHDLFLELLGPMGEQVFNREKEKGLEQVSITNYIKEIGRKGILTEETHKTFLDRINRIFQQGKS